MFLPVRQLDRVPDVRADRGFQCGFCDGPRCADHAAAASEQAAGGGAWASAFPGEGPWAGRGGLSRDTHHLRHVMNPAIHAKSLAPRPNDGLTGMACCLSWCLEGGSGAARSDTSWRWACVRLEGHGHTAGRRELLQGIVGGDEGIRTPDPLRAKLMERFWPCAAELRPVRVWPRALSSLSALLPSHSVLSGNNPVADLMRNSQSVEHLPPMEFEPRWGLHVANLAILEESTEKILRELP